MLALGLAQYVKWPHRRDSPLEGPSGALRGLLPKGRLASSISEYPNITRKFAFVFNIPLQSQYGIELEYHRWKGRNSKYF